MWYAHGWDEKEVWHWGNMNELRNVPKVRGQSVNPMCCMIPCAAQMNSKTESRWEDSGWGLCKNGEWQLVNTGFSKHDDCTLGFKCEHVCTTAWSENHYTFWMVEESSRFNLWYQTTKRKQNDRHLLSVYKALGLILILHNKYNTNWKSSMLKVGAENDII